MYTIRFYKDKNGREPVKDYLKSLADQCDKNSRVNLNKIRDYLKILSEHGTRAGEPYVKHISGDIWELRPLRNRILFFGYDGQQIVLLSHFIKKTQKTPQREIDQAKKRMNEFLEGRMDHEDES